MSSEIIIPLNKAFELCKTHREKNGAKIFSQCWGCMKASKEVPEKMCFYNPPKNNGCKHVNKQFEQINSK